MGSNAKEEGIDQPETIEELEIKYGIGASEKTGKSGYLLHEDGTELERKLQLEDAAQRKLMVESVKKSATEIKEESNKKKEIAENEYGKQQRREKVRIKSQQRHKTKTETKNTEKTMAAWSEDEWTDQSKWKTVNIGRTLVSRRTRHNLFAAVSAAGSVLGTVMKIGQNPYLVDGMGTRYALQRAGAQLRFKARITNEYGKFREVEFVHDTGAASNIIKLDDAALWEDRGAEVVSMSGFNGAIEVLKGGADLTVWMKPMSEENNPEQGLQKNFDIEEVVAMVAAYEAARPTDEGEIEVSDLEGVYNLNIEEILDEITDTSTRRHLLSKIKSARTFQEIISEGETDAQDGDEEKHVEATKKWNDTIRIVKRMKEMERQHELHPHLGRSALNKAVEDGIIKGGIELEEPIHDEADEIGRGTKAGISRKRTRNQKKKQARDAIMEKARKERCPFFLTMGDLIVLKNETSGNRFGYEYILTLMCADAGCCKIYPLKGKDDVPRVWRQFKQWLKVMSPFSKAKLGMDMEVVIFASDRGSEFITTAGRELSAMEEELVKDDIARWNPSAGDSNKLGKIERFNRTLMEAVEVWLRRGGARNIYTYDAATMFECHFNGMPTSSNKTGDGEAPYETLGIPIDRDRWVRFMCPAWITMPDPDVEKTKKKTKHLVGKKKRCFIIGYGSNMYEGADFDGYKVILPSGEIYASRNVTPTPNMEVTRSFLTGLRHDPLNEGKLVERIFDIEGEEQLRWEPGSLGVREEPSPNKAPTVATGHHKTNTRSSSNRMTAGTGATGQMLHERSVKDERRRKEHEAKQKARREIRLARKAKMGLQWIEPEAAGKNGTCRTRYDHYWNKVTTFEEYDELRKKHPHLMTSGDLVHDWIRQFVTPRKIEGSLDLEDIDDDDITDEFESRRIDDINEMVEEEIERGMEMDEDYIYIAEETGFTKYKQVDGSVVLEASEDKTMGADTWARERMRDQFFEEIVQELKMELNTDENPPVWLALAAFHNAVIYKDGRRVPKSIKEAMRLPEWKDWEAAIKKEVEGLIEIGLWAEVPRESVPKGIKILPGKMVLDIKLKDGNFEKCKARYVLRGDLGKHGEHFWETSSHQARSKSMRMMYANAVADYGRTRNKSYIVRNLDVKQAYLRRMRKKGVDPDLYGELPDFTAGVCRDKSSGYVALMNRFLYGDPSSGRAFEREMCEFMDAIGAVATVTDRMVFQWSWKGHKLEALCHVDDVLYNGSSMDIVDEFFKRANEFFGECTGGEVADFVLGIKVEWDLEKMTVKLSQRAHMEKFLEEFEFDPKATKPKRTPLPVNVNAKANTGTRVPRDEWDYFKFCGYANWLAVNTMPGLAGAVNLVGRFSQNPGDDHIYLQRHILRYLAGHLDEGLTFWGDPAILNAEYETMGKLIMYVDSDYGGCEDDKRSTTGVIIKLNGAAVIWRALKQRVNTTATSHAEMNALASGIKELVWAVDHMDETGREQSTVRVLEDNQSTLLQATGDFKSGKSDHYRKMQFYCEDHMRKGLYWIDKVHTDDNESDLHTKQVAPAEKYEKLRDRVNGTKPFTYVNQTIKDIINGKYG